MTDSKTKPAGQHSVYILWGDMPHCVTSTTFETEAEANAYRQGIADADGYLGAEEISLGGYNALVAASENGDGYGYTEWEELARKISWNGNNGEVEAA